MFAGNPLWVEERQRAGFDGNSEFAVNKVPRCVGSVDRKRHRLAEDRRNTDEKQKYAYAENSNRFHGPIEPENWRHKKAQKPQNDFVLFRDFDFVAFDFCVEGSDFRAK